MAPVAAHLAMGLPPCDLGPALKRKDCVLLDMLKPHIEKKTLTGKIISTDRFGNLCTNISRSTFQQFTHGKNFTISTGSLRLTVVSHSYEEQEHGRPLAIFDSHDMLEIAASGGNASEIFSLTPGNMITITT
jgi:S-adenosylmethionine hydrolase